MASFLLVGLCLYDNKATEMIKSYTGELVIELGEHKRTKARNEFEGTHAERLSMGTSRLNVGDSYFEWDTFGLFFWDGNEWTGGDE